MTGRNRTLAYFAAAAVFVLLLASTVSARLSVMGYERRAANEYKSSLYGLAQCVGEIDTLIEKGMCTGSVQQFSKTAAMLESQAQQAKLLLGRLPVSSGYLDEVSRFLSQVGDYSLSVSGERLGEEEYAVLGRLRKSAGSLRIALEELLTRADDGGWEDDLAGLNAVFDGGEIPSSLDGAAQDFIGAGELVYDGAFSDHVFDRAPAVLENRDSVTVEQAQRSAERVTDSKLEYAGEETGALPAYVFEGKNVEVSVCAAGGDVVYMLDSSMNGLVKLDAAAAAERADAFLAAYGCEDMVRISGMVLDDRCVFSYAYTQDGIVMYPDQIKVTVSLDNGEICAFDARDYLVNHREREFDGAAQPVEKARAAVSERLTVEESRMAVIMTDGLNERLCYEFECSTPEGETALVCINALTLEEERVEVVHGENEFSAL